MGVSAKQFLESLSSHSILSPGDLSTIREKLAPDVLQKDAEALARELVKAGKLTKYQAAAIYHGRGKGLVLGEYVVLDKLGAGAMGQVFKAQHRRMKRVVALKLLPPHAMSSQKMVQRFFQEVEVAAKLTHPNVVTAHDAGESNGLHYLVMEHVDGKDLSSYLKEKGPLSVEQAINCILQAARGLEYAHRQGVVHRDVKPSNLLLDREGVVKVLDLGLARIESPLAGAVNHELTTDGEIMGTVDYMAPEQAQDTRTADHRADVYSLGCTLYRLLNDKPTFNAPTTIGKILAHREHPIPSLRAERPEVPEAVDQLFQRMLSKNLTDRPPMSEVVKTLETCHANADGDRSNVNLGEEIRNASDYSSFLDSLKAPSLSTIVRANEEMDSSAVVEEPSVRLRNRKSKARQQRAASDTPVEDQAAKKKKLILAGAGVLALLLFAGGGYLIFGGGARKAGNQVAKSANPTAATAEAASPTNPAAASDNKSTTTTAAADTKNPASKSGTEVASTQPTKGPAFDLAAKTAGPGTASSSDPGTKSPANTVAATLGASLKRGTTVDLLKLIDLSEDIVRGQWKLEGDVLLSHPGDTAVLQLPTPPPQYELLMVTEPQQGHDGLFLGFVMAGTGGCIAIDGRKGEFSGLHTLDGKGANDNESTYRGRVLDEGRGNTIICRVTKDAMQVHCNGNAIVTYAGPTNRLGVSPVFAGRDARKLSLGAFRTAYRVTKLEMTPLEENTAPAPTNNSNPPGNTFPLPNAAASDILADPVNLLKLVDVAKHSVVGAWTREGDSLVSPTEVDARLQVPFTPPEEYDLVVVAERRSGEESLRIGLISAGRQFAFVVGNQNNRIAGLSQIDGRATGDNESSSSRDILRPNKPATFVCMVRKDRVVVTADKSVLIDWSGNPSRLTNPPSTNVPNKKQLYLGALTSSFRISKLEIRPPGPLPSSISQFDVLATLDTKRDTTLGTWRLEQNVLSVERGATDHTRIMLPAERAKSYILTVTAERIFGASGLGLGLPIGSKRVLAYLDRHKDTPQGFEQVSRHWSPEFCVGPQQRILPFGVPHTLVCRVNQTPPLIEVFCDGRLKLRWQGGIETLFENKEFAVPQADVMYLTVGRETGFRFTRITVEPWDWSPQPVPTNEEKKDAETEVKSLLPPAGSKSQPVVAKLATVDEILRKAAHLGARPAAQYMLLEEALRLAVEAGHLPLAQVALADLALSFQVDQPDLQKRTLADLVKNAKSNTAKQQLSEDMVRAMDAAVLRQQFSTAYELQAALSGLLKTGITEFHKEVRIRGTEYALWKSLYDAYESGRAALASSPQDRNAAAAVARYQALVLNDWTTASASLQSSDPVLQAIVALELAAPTEPDKQSALGDAWWNLSEQEKSGSPLKSLYAERAAVWYARAVAKATGRTRANVDLRRSKIFDLRKRTFAAFAQRHPVDAVKIGDHWYKYYPDRFNWLEANEFCERAGGSLAIIDSPAKNAAIGEFVIRQAATNQESIRVWLGASDADVEGDFRWPDGTPLKAGYTNWNSNEPNNAGGIEDYIVSTFIKEKQQLRSYWNDEKFDVGGIVGMICEWAY